MRMTILTAVAGVTMLFSTTAQSAPTSNGNTYPLSTCIVSGKSLDDSDDVATTQVGDREIRFCSKACVVEFKKNQSSYLGKLDEAIIQTQAPLYPLETCLVSGEKLGGDMGEPVNHIVGNRLVRLCCKMCKKDLAADQEKYLTKLDEAVIASQVEGYPAVNCPISGQELGEMGDPFNYVFAGTLVRFCCGGCVSKFNANPTAALATVYGAEVGKLPVKVDPGHKH